MAGAPDSPRNRHHLTVILGGTVDQRKQENACEKPEVIFDEDVPHVSNSARLRAGGQDKGSSDFCCPMKCCLSFIFK
jgi:hypothetical protein